MKIRNGFVSNSSSSSFIVIGNSGQTELPNIDNGVFYIGKYGKTQFGWEIEKSLDPHSRINFTWLQAKYLEDTHPEYMEMLEEILKENLGCERVESLIYIWMAETPKDDMIEGYIDHQSAGYENENLHMFRSKDNLFNFLFDRDSYVQTDNDNH